MKKYSLVTLVLVLALSLVGCTRSGEKALYQGLQKSLDINSMEGEMEILFKVDGEDLNDLKFNINQKQSTNSEGTVGKAEIELIADLGGMKTDLGIWVDMDIEDDNLKMLQTIKMPQLLMSQYGPEVVGKEYVTLDINDMAEQDKEMDFSKIMNLSKELQPKMEEFMKTYFDEFEIDDKLITYKGKDDLDGQRVSKYEVKLSDQRFKKLMRSVVNYSLEKEDNTEFLKDYMDLMVVAMEMTSPELQEFEDIKDEIQVDVPEIKENFNKFMDSIEATKFIGEKGVVYKYAIDEKGYIVNEDISIDLRIDTGKILEAFMGQVEIPEEIINLEINIKSKIKNINKQQEITIPKTNKDNSIGYIRLMEIQEEQLEQQLKLIEQAQ